MEGTEFLAAVEQKPNSLTARTFRFRIGSNRSTPSVSGQPANPNLMIGREPTAVNKPCASIAITPVLRAITFMAVDELDSVVFQMAVESVRSLPLSFIEKAAAIAARSRGVLLFDVRVYGDAEVQRVAAMRYPGDQTGVLTLDRQGHVTRHCIVNSAFSRFIVPLENWASMPLSMQAKIDVDGHASLFLGALRKAGHMLGS